MHPFQLSDCALQRIQGKLAEKRLLAQGREQALFDVLDDLVDEKERVALEFLYAFMPLVDLGDYDSDLFLKHVRHSLKTLEKMPWGNKITGELYLHYILPYRITNETIEGYRPYFYDELYDRVKCLSMAEAILEINHWCHEKATYIAADPRTASPLTTIRAARGRCGEESALLVTALRSLGIPARQVYVPRWAHTDSNHAWVEAWADGEWFFLGACEPEPRLNMGWFVGPATRAMLIHTKVPGTIYAGPEERVQVVDDYTELNLLANYALTQRLTVEVVDQKGRPVPGAVVEFQVYNYAGFSALTSLKTDEGGKASLTTGFGDLLVHAFTEQDSGSILAKGDGPRRVKVVLGAEVEDFVQLELKAPIERTMSGPEVSQGEKEENTMRLKLEDEIRGAHERTFLKKSDGQQIADGLGLEPEKVWSVLERARGNSREIAAFLEEAVPEFGSMALELANVLSPKDLTDTTKDALQDHLKGALLYEGIYPDENFIQHVLQPRVSLEVLRPYREFFQEEFTLSQQEAFLQNPLEIKTWINRHVATIPDGLVRGWPTPRGVYELRVGNFLAKQILFVAMARSFGIAAQISTVDGRAMYLHEEEWVEVSFDEKDEDSLGYGTIRLHKSCDKPSDKKYYTDFSLARWDGQMYRTLRFRGLDEEHFNEEGFSPKLKVREGFYRLVTGSRLANGSVLATLSTFMVEPEQTTDVELIFALETAEGTNLGQMPQCLAFFLFGANDQVVIDDLLGENGIILAWIEPEREPTKHLLRDLMERKTQFEALGSSIVLILGADKVTGSFAIENYAGLPKNTLFVKDDRYKALAQVQKDLTEAMPEDFPMVMAVDRAHRVRYISTGYHIGTGAQILSALK